MRRVRDELIELDSKPTIDELLSRVRARMAATSSRLPAARILAHRDERSAVTVVVHASAVVAALVDHGDDGTWAEAELVRDDLAAPHLMPVEVASIVRRAVLARHLSLASATLAHSDLLRLPVELFPWRAEPW